MSIYEVHLGSWRPGLGYRELADELADYVTRLGFTHVELLPVAEHPFGGSWGYQVTSYYAPDRRASAPPTTSATSSTALHQARHRRDRRLGARRTSRRTRGRSARFDGTPLYEHADPRRGEHPDWGTYVFDFGRHEVRNFLVANALYWLEEFHVDGLRVDAVASMLYLDYSRKDGEWVPTATAAARTSRRSQFLQELNATVYKRHPRRRDDRRGVHGVARRHAPDRPRRARLRLQVEHGLDARHARLPGARADLPVATTTTR